MRLRNTARAFKLYSRSDLRRHRLLFEGLGAATAAPTASRRCIEGFMRLKPPVAYPLVRDTLFAQFCGGEKLEELRPEIRELEKVSVAPLLNYGVEYSEDEGVLKETASEMRAAVDFLAEATPDHRRGQLILRPTGLMSARRLAAAQTGTLAPEDRGQWDEDKARFGSTCEHAASRGVPLLVDAETMDIQDKIHELAVEAMRDLNGPGVARVYSTIQFYRKDSADQLGRLISDSSRRGYTAGLKLVRGAYMRDEELAGRRGELHATKEDTSSAYNGAVRECLDRLSHMSVVIASHNEETVDLALDGLETRGVQPQDRRVVFAQMRGMRPDLTFNLAPRRVLSFFPYGPRDHLFPYLVRRGLENSTALSGAAVDAANARAEQKRRRYAGA